MRVPLSRVDREKRQFSPAGRRDNVAAGRGHTVHAVIGIREKRDAGPIFHKTTLTSARFARRPTARKGALARTPITFTQGLIHRGAPSVQMWESGRSIPSSQRTKTLATQR